MIERVNLFPVLMNRFGKPTKHEFVGFREDEDRCFPMFRCTETGEDRSFGVYDIFQDLKPLYGTARRYRSSDEDISNSSITIIHSV